MSFLFLITERISFKYPQVNTMRHPWVINNIDHSVVFSYVTFLIVVFSYFNVVWNMITYDIINTITIRMNPNSPPFWSLYNYFSTDSKICNFNKFIILWTIRRISRHFKTKICLSNHLPESRSVAVTDTTLVPIGTFSKISLL